MIGKRVRLRDDPEGQRTLPTFLIGKTGVVVGEANHVSWLDWKIELNEPGEWLKENVWACTGELEVID